MKEYLVKLKDTKGFIKIKAASMLLEHQGASLIFWDREGVLVAAFPRESIAGAIERTHCIETPIELPKLD